MKKEIILGLTGPEHSSAAALMIEGELIAAAEEERFSRVKNYTGFPSNAVKFCLRYAGISAGDITDIAVGEVLLQDRGKRAGIWFEGLDALCDEGAKLDKINWVPHHLSHIAAVFYIYNVGEAAFLNIDRSGEQSVIAGGEILNDSITVKFEVAPPHSLGALYAAITEHLGFRRFADEYKVMGLASFGTPSYIKEVSSLIALKGDGRLELNGAYFKFGAGTCREGRDAEQFSKLLGRPRLANEKLDLRHADIAASLQVVMKDAVQYLLAHLKKLSACQNLCYTGELALNCAVNTAVAESGIFKKIFVHPACHDAGTAIGACFYTDRITRLRSRRPVSIPAGVYLGNYNSCEQVRNEVVTAAFPFEELYEEELIRRCAKDLADGRVVAWFQGRTEWGHRALGNRSILADPRDADMTERINAKIKYRETFRPFAPSVLAEEARGYFEYPEGIDMSHMLYLANANEITRRIAPAVVHVDGTSRIQTVSYQQNPVYWRLISAFYQLTGVPMVLNTSFNVKDEPIVNTPGDAIRCFASTDIDVMYIGNFRLAKIENKQSHSRKSLLKGGGEVLARGAVAGQNYYSI